MIWSDRVINVTMTNNIVGVKYKFYLFAEQESVIAKAFIEKNEIAKILQEHLR